MCVCVCVREREGEREREREDNLSPNVSLPAESVPGILQLSPAPGEKDYFFHLDDQEGVLDLYDIKKPSTSVTSTP